MTVSSQPHGMLFALTVTAVASAGFGYVFPEVMDRLTGTNTIPEQRYLLGLCGGMAIPVGLQFPWEMANILAVAAFVSAVVTISHKPATTIQNEHATTIQHEPTTPPPRFNDDDVVYDTSKVYDCVTIPNKYIPSELRTFALETRAKEYAVFMRVEWHQEQAFEMRVVNIDQHFYHTICGRRVPVNKSVISVEIIGRGKNFLVIPTYYDHTAYVTTPLCSIVNH